MRNKRAAFCICNRETKERSGEKRTTRSRASLTVEAALVVPFFFFAVVFLVNIMDLYRLHGLLTLSLHQSACELALYGGAAELGEGSGYETVETAASVLYARSRLPQEVLDRGSVSFSNTSVRGDVLELRAVYIPKLGNGLIPMRFFSMSACARTHLFSGYTGEEQDAEGSFSGPMVYVAEHGTVYHTDSSCGHIQVNVREIPSGWIADARSSDGGRYTACERCVGDGLCADHVYVSESGNRYHNRSDCSGLKRSVRMMPLQDVQGLQECEQCRRRREKQGDSRRG